mmetsp:Transcript_3641/g.7721  ORF Transcript_3641/g.7721 Transcript_3641/m.7721 type:complete len:373 (+) Transcript_3641:790-1908(+)
MLCLQLRCPPPCGLLYASYTGMRARRDWLAGEVAGEVAGVASTRGLGRRARGERAKLQQRRRRCAAAVAAPPPLESGMGLDGGTIVTRSDHLRRASWRLANHDGGSSRSTRGGQLGGVNATAAAGVQQRDRQQDAVNGFSCCALSGASLPLRPADGEVVSCALGNLYLRTAVVEWLTRSGQFDPSECDGSGLEIAFGHVARLRDVFSLALTPNPQRTVARTDAAEGLEPSLTGAWICPIDRSVDSNGTHPFVALRPCGHVIRHAVAAEISRGLRSLAPGLRDQGPSGKAHLSDGISSIEAAAWGCPVCSSAVEVLTRLLPEEAAVDKVRATLRAERMAGLARKRKRLTQGGAQPAAFTSQGALSASSSRLGA